MLVTKSVFKFIFVLSIYQTCTFPLIAYFNVLITLTQTVKYSGIDLHCIAHTPEVALLQFLQWKCIV